MKRLVIVVEGDSEKEFVDRLLRPYLFKKGVLSVTCFKIKHTKGGLTRYQHLKTDLINCIFETDIIITTLIDYYALPKDFPKYDESKSIVVKAERLDFLEQAIVDDIQLDKNRKFNNLIPYIQLHEFEALVFSSLKAIKELYSDQDAKYDEIEFIIQNHPNPEDINNSPETAPSKRLLNNQLIRGYNKVNDGIMIIEEAGLEIILEKCTRFNAWVSKLIEKILE